MPRCGEEALKRPLRTGFGHFGYFPGELIEEEGEGNGCY